MPKRPCTCDREGCPPCDLFKTDPRYKAYWSDQPTSSTIADGTQAVGYRPCKYLGKRLRDNSGAIIKKHCQTG